MLPLYQDPFFTFRFAEDRLVPRFHLEGVEKGRLVSVVKIEPGTGKRTGLLALATVGEAGWVDLPEPLVVRAGEAFVAVPMIVREEGDGDADAVREVNRSAFEPDGEGEDRLVDALRAGGFARLSLVAEVHSKVVAHILFSDLKIVTAAGEVSALALAPMAVLPEYQRLGIGSALVRQALEQCKRQGHRIVVVLGHPDYYPRFGFSSKLAERLQSPFGSGPAHMALALNDDALEGVAGHLVYAAPFTEL